MGRSKALPQGFVCKFYRKQFLHARQPAIKIPFKPGTNTTASNHCRPRRPSRWLVALLFYVLFILYIFLRRNNPFNIHALKVFYILFLNILY